MGAWWWWWTLWCEARSNAGYGALKSGLAFACSHGADCRAIQPGGSCFNPNTIQNHASYAFDSYYQTHAKNPAACNFGGTATIAVTNPSIYIFPFLSIYMCENHWLTIYCFFLLCFYVCLGFGRCVYPPFSRYGLFPFFFCNVFLIGQTV